MIFAPQFERISFVIPSKVGRLLADLCRFLIASASTRLEQLARFNVLTMTTAYRHEVPKSGFRGWVDVAAPAKINLFLEVLAKRADGFHELETVMAAVDWYDRLRFIPRSDDQIQLKLIHTQAPHSFVPVDERNLVLRALQLLRENSDADWLPGFDILLYKVLPTEAGLGGASSDAAAALLAGKLLWNLNLPDTKLHLLAAELGSDIPFFLQGGAALCRGRGEQIESLKAPAAIPVVIVKPPFGLSTREVFSQVRLDHNIRSAESFRQNFVQGRLELLGKELWNRLSETAVKLNEQILDIAKQFARTQAIGHQMSGSGSSYFGLFRSLKAARQTARLLSIRLPQARIFVGQTLKSAQPRLSVKRVLVG